MVKIKVFGIRDEERPIAEAWAKENNVTIDLTSDIIRTETIDSIKGFDGVTTTQTATIPTEAYRQLKEMGIKQIAQRSAGFDMYDLEEASKNDIIISNVPSYSPESIAEFAVTLALQLIRKTEEIQRNTQAHDFRWQPSIRARVLGEMTVAVIGTGRIGQMAAKMFKGFGANVIGYDLYPNEFAKEHLSYVDSIEEAIQQADIISLHMPATKDTHHLFNLDLFKQMKSDAYLVNTARGTIVKTEDLITALDEGLIAGAGLDTYEFESTYVPKDCRDQVIEDEQLKQLLAHPQIIFTPHIAFYTDTAVKNLVEGGLNAALEVINTGTTATRVN
ncbi:D-2-hydroxyacid dehydrogenase [Atopobacter phocae]|uniref:D-2-hydroxyacid dehydrogenase n=1 Tax=Atopobacter phocae TaxID=136492 RepID=UPI00046F8A8C|nr:D-2-hydroxyacid dehydrogenase [Atopobacter phocae]